MKKEDKHPDRRNLGEIMQRREWSLDQAQWFDKLGAGGRHTRKKILSARESRSSNRV